MSTFEEYRKKLQEKYGNTEESKTKNITTTTGSSSFDEVRNKLNAKYNSDKVMSSDVDTWFKEVGTTLTSMQDYHKQNAGKYNAEYGGDLAKKVRELMTSSGDIYNYIQNHKNEFSNYKDLATLFSEYRSALEQNQLANYDASRFYSQFDNEVDYNQYAADRVQYEKYKQMASTEEAKQGWEKYTSDLENAKAEKEKSWSDTINYDFNGSGEIGWFENLVEKGAKVVDKVTRYLANDGGGVTDTTLPTGAGLTQTVNALRADKSYQQPNDSWDEEQKNIFGALYMSSPEEAYKYAEYINNSINLAEEEALKKIAESATENGWAGFGHTLGAIATAPLGMADFLNDLAMKNAGRDIAPDGQVSPFEYSQAVTGGITTHLNEQGGTLSEDIPIFGGKGWGDVYGLGVSIAQSMASAYALGETGTLVSYFGQGAASGVDEALARGATDKQAILYGTALGLFEGIAEKIGVDNLFKLGSGFVKNILKQAAAEGLEEGITSVLSNIADNVIMQDKSNFNSLVSQYIAQGMSEEEAKKKAWKDSVESIAFDIISGSASGGVSGGIHTTAQTIASDANAKKMYGTGTELVAEALDINPDNAFAQKMQSRLDNGKTLSGAQLNRLVEYNDNAIQSEMKASIEKELTDIGETGDIEKLADIIAKEQMGKELTKKESKLLANSKYKNTTNNETKQSDTDKTPTAKEIATETKFEVSENGKTMLGDTEVTIKEIASVKDGEVTLRLDDGSTVKASDVEYGSNAEGLLYENVVEMGLNAATANAFVKGYDPSVNVQEYIHGFREAYRYGEYGFPKSEMSAEGFSSRLSESQKSLAYDLGKTDAKYKAEKKQSEKAKIASTGAIKADKNASTGKKKAKLHNTLTPTNETQRASLKALGVLAEALDIDIYTFESPLVNGRRIGKNGSYDPVTRRLEIDLYAGADGKGTMLFTAAHELTHHIRATLPAKFKAFADFLFEQYGEKGVSVSGLIAEKIKHLEENGRTKGKTEAEIYDLAYEEVVADACESFLADGEAIAKIAELKAKDKTLWQTIKDFITNLVARIKAAYEGLSPDSVEGRIVAEMLDSAEQLKAMWTEMLVEASDSHASAASTNHEADGEVKFDDRDSGYDVDAEINESMTMEQAKQMIQRAFVMGGIKEWYDGEYKNGDEWARAQGADEVASYVDNEYHLQELYINKIPGILEDRFYISDVIEAYLNGTLTGKVKQKAQKLNLANSVKVADPRFYAPQAIADAKALYEVANQRVNEKNRANVYKARAKILLYAHNKGAAETLGITESDLNKKLRSWSNYSSRAKNASVKINAGIEESNRWTGIENMSYINKTSVSANDVARMVKAIEGKSDDFQNKYIARTMLALDTHIDWSWLTFKFDTKQGVNESIVGGSGRANGYYRDSERLIHAIPNSPNTIAHEMGHALDHQLARDLGFGSTSLTEAYRNTEKLSGDVKIWFDQFKNFADDLAESASLYSAYTMDIQEVFARFVAKFVEWTEVIATGRSSGYETSYYNDKFTTTQFVEFARILQGKAALDANGLTANKVGVASSTTKNETVSREGFNYSLVETVDGKLVAVVEDDILSGIYTGTWDKVTAEKAKKAAKTALLKFKGGIAVKGITAKVNRTTRREYTRSNYSEALRNHDPDTYADKLRSASVADDIVIAATNWKRDGGLTHPRKDDFVDFDRGQTLIMSGKNQYTAEVIIGITSNGEFVFYDVEAMNPTQFDIKNERDLPTVTPNESFDDILKVSNGGIISQDSDSVKRDGENILYSDRVSYAPTFYSHMGKVIDDIRLDKMGAGGVVSYLKGKGVKNDEIKWSGIDAWLEGKKSVTKAELQEFVAGSQLEIVEQMSDAVDVEVFSDDGDNYKVRSKTTGMIMDEWEYSDDVEDGLEGWVNQDGEIALTIGEIEEKSFKEFSSTRWGDYKIEGGENYRELVFKIPNSSYSNQAMRSHWGDEAEGVLAHARIQDMTTVDGKKMLFIEEIQSDWHNEGQKKGYAAKLSPSEEKRVSDLYDKQTGLFERLGETAREMLALNDKFYKKEISEEDYIPQHQKVTKLLNELQAEENSVRKERMALEGNADGVPDAPFRTNYHEYVLKRLLRMAAEEGYDSIGWTPSEIQVKRWSEEFAEGYRIEYDQEIPKFLRKYGKRWGATVGKTMLDQGYEYSELEIDAQRDNLEYWRNELTNSPDSADFIRSQINHTEEEIRRMQATGEVVWSMDITESMKDSVLNEGQVLYSDRYSDGLSEADKETAKKVISGLKTHAGVAKYGIRSMGAYTEERMDREIDYSSSDTVLDYAKSYITWVEPIDFIYATTTSEKMRETLKEEAGDLNIEKLRAETQPIHLTVDFDTGKIVGHEGRHRMLALQKAGVSKVAVVIDAWNDDRYNTKPIEMMHLIGQNFGGYGHGVDFFLHDMLPLSKRYADVAKELFSIEPKNGVRFSDRNSNSVSNRSLLANALESVAQDDIERRKLEEYKSKIALIESEQAKLAELKSKIKELSFPEKGTRRDTETLKKLQFEANQSANRINTYDRQLLTLESTKALKGVLNREKQMAYKRAEQRGREALKEQRDKDRERNAKTQRELMNRYQESRTKGIESRKKTEMRYKIKTVVNDLYQYLEKGTKEKHVPISLQKPVAEALAAVNMDTVGAEERIAKKREEMRIAASKGNMDKVNQLAKEIDHIQEMGGNMEEKLSRLKTAYDSIINSDDPLIANSHDDVIANTIDKVIEVVGDTPLRDMSLYQLEAVYDMYRMVLTSVRNANKAFKAEKGKEISVLANTVIADLDGKKRNPLNVADTNFAWNNLKPVYAFERIGSNTFTKLFNAVRAGEDVWATDMSEAKAFREEQSKKHNYDSWDFEKKYPFKSQGGKEFELSLGEMMSIYAFAKDDHSKGHLIGEGFVFDTKKKVAKKTKSGIKIKVDLEDANSYNLSEQIVADIISTLDKFPGAKDFVDEMQDYLSTTMGEKGNEVSLELYEVKLFKNKNYFPLKSAPQYMAVAKENAQGDVKIKNKGFTKDRKEGAQNPIVLSSFMDVWANHVNEMSMYHAFTLPLEDFYRVFNYKTPRMDGYAPMSVNASIQNAFGEAATSYIEQLLKDLNGGARSDPRETIGKAMMSNFKKASVMASWSVVIQQPSAIERAKALVSDKYFIGKPSMQKHKVTWAEVKKYAPVAVIKEMGYFDTGMGKGSVEWLKGDKTFMDKVDDAVSKAPALADELTWCAIWNAVKRETLHTHKDLKPNSDEFLKAVGERFTEVIVKTQVYDSTLARSANMRSKSTFMNMVTSFMAEPTTSINMAQDSFRKGKRGKYTVRVVSSVFRSVILCAALVSIIYASRDDDEDETFLEKYLSRFTTDVIDGVNPITYIPFFKDVWSILQGFDVERADMTLVTKLSDSLQQLVKVISKDTSEMDDEELADHKKAINEAIMSITDNLANLVGVPVRNVRRDLNGIINGFNTIKKDATERDTTSGSLGDIIGEDLKNSVPIWGWFPDEKKTDKIYDAIIKGDTAYADRFKESYDDENAYTRAVRKALRENDPRIHDAAVARNAGRNDEYMRIVREIKAERNFTQDDIVSAVNAEISKLKPDKESELSKPEYVTVDDYYKSVVNGDTGTAQTILDVLVAEKLAEGYLTVEAKDSIATSFSTKVKDAYMEGDLNRSKAKSLLISNGGKTDNEAETELKKCDFELKHDIAWSEIARAYRLGKITESTLISAVMDIEGESRENAEEYIRFLELELDNPNIDITASDAKGFFEYAEPAGIGIEVYLDYKEQTRGLTGDKDANGKTISGSKKAKVMEVIDSLPITYEQKDALYYANDWSAKSIWEAPWH